MFNFLSDIIVHFLIAISIFAIVLGSLFAMAWAWDNFHGIIGAGIVFCFLAALFSALCGRSK